MMLERANEGVRRTRLYYGWVIVSASALAMFFSGPGQTYTVSIFLDYYIESLNVSRSLVSGMYSAASFLSGCLLFLIGISIDRYGQRAVAVVASVLLGLTCLWNSYVTGPAMLCAGFFCLRFFGPGSLMLVPNTLVPQWFVNQRGRAFSFVNIGGFLGAMLFPSLSAWLILVAGVPGAWKAFAAVLVIGFAPLAFVLIRNTPESVGLLPDSPSARKRDSLVLNGKASAENWTLREAMRVRAFWLLLFCLTIPAAVHTGTVFHLVSIFAENGLHGSVAPLALAVLPLVSFATGLAAGYLNERIGSHVLLAAMFLLYVFAMVVLLVSFSIAMAISFAVLSGMVMGMEGVTFSVIWPDYFGRKYIGSINSVAMTARIVGSSFGPLPFGVAYDIFGGYKEIIAVMAVMAVCGMIAALFAPPPRRVKVG